MNKFRVWFPNQKEFIYFGEPYICFEYGTLSFGVTDKKYQGICELPDDYPTENLIIQQATGLKDKNNLEIYNGDIFSSKSHDPKNYEVKFIEGSYCAYTKNLAFPIDINHFFPSNGTDIEIVGNNLTEGFNHKLIMNEQDYKTVETMEKYGGSFVKQLAYLIRLADQQNFMLIKNTWSDYWNQYEEMSKK